MVQPTLPTLVKYNMERIDSWHEGLLNCWYFIIHSIFNLHDQVRMQYSWRLRLSKKREPFALLCESSYQSAVRWRWPQLQVNTYDFYKWSWQSFGQRSTRDIPLVTISFWARALAMASSLSELTTVPCGPSPHIDERQSQSHNSAYACTQTQQPSCPSVLVQS